ncbi:hypothetical protein I302_106672 [Kwoniella bestiolae CBS 10118]|uniref:ABC transporter domain-containing protein n=1 Tax=Kwoniella bestiolae CBS 10118 TaxID=1296100 RepID=A0A1B9G0R2_9TREE|nr:hypothetical protein I302_06066 [Kwoniella bestiolae CBS 10118]OCF24605.1 hypothetical protein I302_06066 [Kwoniella bestiolae CBS 10118]
MILPTLLFLFLPLTLAQTCSNFGTSRDSTCLCPPGFNVPSSDCGLPVCGGNLYNPGEAAPGGVGGFGNVSADAGGCGCDDGWRGPGCTVCTSSSSCSSSLTRYLNSSNSLSSSNSALNNTLTCSTIPVVYSSSQLTCSVIQSTLQALFPGSSTATITRSLNSSLTPGGTNTLTQGGLLDDDGQVQMQLWYEGVEQFYCQATGCTQNVVAGQEGNGNASTWNCPEMECRCRTGTLFCGGGSSPSQNLTGAINTLAGPLTIDCFASNTCNFKQSFLVALFGTNGLELSSCSFGECVQQYVIDQALGITTAADSGNGLSGGVIAGLAVVGAILLAIIGVVIWGLIRRKKARREMDAKDTIHKPGGVGIQWKDVGYTIRPSSYSSKWSRNLHNFMKGSGRRLDDNSVEKATPTKAGEGNVVLAGSSGSIPPGGFACILGPSGAGKSTLVDILAGKRKEGIVKGSVGFMKEDGRVGRVRVGYVDQADILSSTSTVLETLIFAAQLRLPESIPFFIKTERAQTVLSQLHLDHIAHTRIGSSEHRGISGGEARRVSIGIELVSSPDILVLDEPTSGLDSVSASRLVRLLKTLAQSGTTIIASIHQPSSALYQAFDQVILLSQGRQLYFGGGGIGPKEYFERKGQKCPEGYNVADWLLEIASSEHDLNLDDGPREDGPLERDSSGETSSSSIEHNGRSLNQGSEAESPLNEKAITYPPSPRANILLSSSTTDQGAHSQSRIKESWWTWPKSHCATTFLTQVEILSGREWRNLKRDKTLLIAHIFFSCLVGIFAGGLYYKVGITIAGFQNRIGSLFFLGSLIAFSSLSALYNLVEVRGLFLRERAGQFYSPQAWLLARVLFDVIPLRLIPTILVSIIVYFMVGLSHDAARFFKFLLIIVEFSMGMTLFNFLLACLFRNGGVAILLSSLCNLFLMTYAGFFVNISQIPPVLRWLRYFSTLGYTLEALSVNEVGSGLQIVDSLNGVRVEIGATIIMQTLFGFGMDDYYRDVLVLFAFIAGFAIGLVFIVVYLLRERR